MTAQSEIRHDTRYTPVLDHGFVGLIDHMGSDAAIVEAARVSYGTGTKSVNQDRGLIRYLMRHAHTSPFEMCEVKVHLRLPIFVMRQLVRHRTASLNEYSGRYSVMTDDMYRPAPDALAPQSDDNKQGRAGTLSDHNRGGAAWMIDAAYEMSGGIYHGLLGERAAPDGREIPYDPYDADSPLFDEDFPGVAREMARIVLPLGTYTELYWKIDLHNLLHMIGLRADAHAQYEIRVFAEAILAHIRPLFPLAVEAWEDYQRNALTLSRMECALMHELLHAQQPPITELWTRVQQAGSAAVFATLWGLSLREFREFVSRFQLGEPLGISA